MLCIISGWRDEGAGKAEREKERKKRDGYPHRRTDAHNPHSRIGNSARVREKEVCGPRAGGEASMYFM